MKQLFSDTVFLLFRSFTSLSKRKIILGTFTLRQKKRFLVKVSLLLNFPSLPPSFMFHGMAIYMAHFSVSNILTTAEMFYNNFIKMFFISCLQSKQNVKIN